MTIDLSSLKNVQRVLFEIPLVPLQGHRFQPTGFPNLGAATFQTKGGQCLLVESAQSMGNWLELTVWDKEKQDVKEELKGISHVRVERNGKFLTDTILESHRLNSPYLLEATDKTFLWCLALSLGMSIEIAVESEGQDGKKLTQKTKFDDIEKFRNFMKDEKNKRGKIDINDFDGLIDRKKFAETLLKYDIGSLLHGVFLAKKDLAGGRLRVARALSAFIEADGVRVAASGGVKNDHVNPSWPKKEVERGFGNIPFARDEYTAERTALYVNLDLAQIRGYGLGKDVERLLILLALYKLRALLDDTLRLRTACDLKIDPTADKPFDAKSPSDFSLPDSKVLTEDLKNAIKACKEKMPGDIATFNDELKKRKDGDDNKGGDNNDGSATDDNAG